MKRVVVGILLLVGGLLGLFMSACGAFISVAMLADRASRQYAGMLILSVPCALVGVLLLWFVWRRFKKFRAPITNG